MALVLRGDTMIRLRTHMGKGQEETMSVMSQKIYQEKKIQTLTKISQTQRQINWASSRDLQLM